MCFDPNANDSIKILWRKSSSQLLSGSKYCPGSWSPGYLCAVLTCSTTAPNASLWSHSM